MKKEIYQHFRPEEYDFIEKIDDIAQRVEETYAYSLTDFLNPRQVDIAKSILGNRGLRYFVSSDYYPAAAETLYDTRKGEHLQRIRKGAEQ